jgi:two-component system response regulator YesN
MFSIEIVDDDIIMQGKIAGYLEKQSDDLVVCAKCINGSSAIAAVREYSPDLLILDMDMPDMTGTQVIRTLSEEKIMPAVLVLSNYDNYEFVREAMKYGSYDYLLKHQLTEDILMDKIAEIRKETKKREHKQNIYTQMKDVALSKMLKDLFLGQADDEIAQEIENILSEGETEKEKKYVCASLRIPDSCHRTGSTVAIDKKKLVRGVLSIADTIYGSVGNGIVCNMDNGEIAVLHAYLSDRQDAEIRNEAEAYAYTLASNVKKLMGTELVYAVGPVMTAIADSYRKARQMLGDKTFDGCSDYVKDTIAYIDSNFEKDINLEGVAKQIHVSSSYLSRLFKREMGMAFIEYLNSYRVKMARKYLEEGEHNLYEISVKSGFNSYNYFLKVYKEYTGLRPSECIQKDKIM